MPVEDIMNERQRGRPNRDVRRMSGAAYEAGGDVPETAKHVDESSRDERKQKKNDAPLRKNPLKGRVRTKGDGNTALSLGNTLLGLL